LRNSGLRDWGIEEFRIEGLGDQGIRGLSGMDHYLGEQLSELYKKLHDFKWMCLKYIWTFEILKSAAN